LVKSVWTGAACGLLAASLAGAARADGPTIFGYDISVALAAQAAPNYEGSKHYTVFPIGAPNLFKPGQFDLFSAADDSFSVPLFGHQRVSVGLAANLLENRGNSGELAGMRNIGWALEAGGYGNWWPTDWLRARIEVRKGLVSHAGLLVDTGLDFVARPNRWMLAVGPRLSFADKSFNDTYFGVSPGEAAASPYLKTPYSPNGGPRYAGFQVSTEYKLRPRVRLTFDTSYRRILGDAANSPLVTIVGARDQFEAGAGLRIALSD
jgi:outer membrane scaffolding protein for murein synthesis (MipA/OmpV family)